MAMLNTAGKREASKLDRRKRRLQALQRIRQHHRDILARRGGEPVDIDAVIEELRGGLD